MNASFPGPHLTFCNLGTRKLVNTNMLGVRMCHSLHQVVDHIKMVDNINLEKKSLQRSHLGKREGFRNFHHLLLMKEDIQKGNSHMHLTQSLLRVLFPHVNDLQCTLLSENDAQQHEALQIHFVAGNIGLHPAHLDSKLQFTKANTVANCTLH